MDMLTRRGFGLAVAGGVVAHTVPARAQSFPERPVRMLIGFPPGGTVDTVARIIGPPMLLVVGKHVRANSVKELQEFAKANPGRLTYGSTGSGSSLHLAGELFKLRAGVDILHVPYRGGAPAVTGLLAGEIDMLLV